MRKYHGELLHNSIILETASTLTKRKNYDFVLAKLQRSGKRNSYLQFRKKNNKKKSKTKNRKTSKYLSSFFLNTTR